MEGSDGNRLGGPREVRLKSTEGHQRSLVLKQRAWGNLTFLNRGAVLRKETAHGPTKLM